VPRVLFDENFLKKLETLRLVALRASGGRREGLRLGGRPGGAIEFRDYREYVPGDDLRNVDWNVYARLDRLYVKQFEREEEARVTILLDASASMASGSPSKFEFGARLAAALAYIALGSLDSVAVGLFRGKKRRAAAGETAAREAELKRLGFLTGTGEIHRVLRFLSAEEPAGPTAVAGALRAFSAGSSGEPGTVLLISDLWDETGFLGELSALAARRYEPAIIHVLAPEELDPELPGGPVRLIDAEAGGAEELDISREALSEYRGVLDREIEAKRRWSREHRLRYFVTASDKPLEETVLDYLRRGRLVE